MYSFLNTFKELALLGLFGICTLLISITRLKLAKNQAKAKQHSDTELLLFENYLVSPSMLSSKNTADILKNKQKTRVSVLMILYD